MGRLIEYLQMGKTIPIAVEKLKVLKQENPKLFYHWEKRILLILLLNNTSRMTGDCHVRFCEGLRGAIPFSLLGPVGLACLPAGSATVETCHGD